ncbi:cytochrome c oxidase assembly protein [Arenimonas sp. GDDSR-1]|uniref:cytochrome c oxidase assembly protein n=1 Tax=Arenimonas sp. GDDSR-1 TaxID=2950125 RepID=UPI00261E6709|nr:cytochrome c oxidase assembly protein [Arenimonas sp. GDDSR-1]
MSAQTQRSTRKMILLAVASFGFAFAMVPMYNIACEKVFGIKLDNSAAAEPKPSAAAVDESRTVQVYFDGTVNSKLPWAFAPVQTSMTVVPGKLYSTSYTARNTAAFATVGNAAPSIAPNQFSAYFSKTECFCFTEQALAAGESRDMPVRFIVSPDLPKEVTTLTLSYTFFINDAATAKLNAGTAAGTALAAP